MLVLVGGGDSAVVWEEFVRMGDGESYKMLTVAVAEAADETVDDENVEIPVIAELERNIDSNEAD